MDDAAYAFAQDVKDRKRTATGAYHKRTGSRSRKVTLSQDTLTHAQWKRRNGPVQTYETNMPHTLKELRCWPKHMQVLYMDELLNRFNPTLAQLAHMLKCHQNYTSAYLRELKLHKKGRPTREEQHAFLDWLDEKLFPPEEDTVVTVETPAEPEVTEPVPRSPSFVPITYDTITLGFTGTVTDLVQSILTGPLHLCGADTYSFTVTAVRKS